MPTSPILIADDSSTIRTQVSRALVNHGYEVIAVRDGREAIEAARANPPGLMVLDINMPDTDGFAVCLELRKMGLPWSAIPIIFLTSSQSHALEVLGDEVGAYLHKPVQEDDLLEAVQSFLPIPTRL